MSELPRTKAAQLLRDRYFGGSTLFDEDMAAIEAEAVALAVPVSDGLDEAVLAEAIKWWYATPVNVSTNAEADSARWIIAKYRRLKAEGSGPQTGPEHEEDERTG